MSAHLMRPSCYDRARPRGQRTFPVKQHDYEGGMLSDGGATRTEGASPPRSHRVIWRWAVGWSPSLTLPVMSDRHGEEHLRPRAMHRKDTGPCTEPGRDLGASRGPSRRTPVMTVLAHGARLCLAGGRHL
jgi:hypothetical protein